MRKVEFRFKFNHFTKNSINENNGLNRISVVFSLVDKLGEFSNLEEWFDLHDTFGNHGNFDRLMQVVYKLCDDPRKMWVVFNEANKYELVQWDS